jgi:hypothetical protein
MAHTDQKAFVNDRLFREKKALILQAETERIAATLFDHLATQGQ